MRAVDALMECLKAEGVDVVFGLPGGANLPTYDAFVDGGIRHILVRHEAGGGHAAEGYAKATGKVGVAFATSGPGATNLITPICDAMMDSVPVVFITGQVRTELLGTDGFQEADTIGITMPIVKHSFMIQHPQEIPRAIHEAFHIARSGRPGPVLVDIPAGPLARGDRLRAGHRRAPARLPAARRGQPEADPPGRQGARRGAAPGDLRGRRRRQRRTPPRELTEFAHLRPLPGDVHADGARRVPAPRGMRPAVARDARHARHARRQLRDGRGRPDLRRRRALRRPHHGQALGVRAAGEVHPHRRRPGGDLQERARAHPDRRRRQARAREAARRVPRDRRRPRPARRVVEPDRRLESRSTRSATRTAPTTRSSRSSWSRRCYEATGGEAIITSDVGQHQMWAAQYYDFPAPRRWINSGGLGTMGFGLPAAMGAAVGCPIGSSAASPATARSR